MVVCDEGGINGGSRIGPFVIKYQIGYAYGKDVGQIISEYSNPYGSKNCEDVTSECPNGLYTEPYIEFYKHGKETKRN